MTEQSPLPLNLKEAIAWLEKEISDSERIEWLKKTDNPVVKVHSSLGRMVRNCLGLWNKPSKLVEWFMDNHGLAHADDISSIIIGAYIAKLKDEDFDVDAEARKFIEFWEKEGVDQCVEYSKRPNTPPPVNVPILDFPTVAPDLQRNNQGEMIDISPEACAVVCMIVSDPTGQLQQTRGWKKRVNDVIRAQRDRIDELNALPKFRLPIIEWSTTDYAYLVNNKLGVVSSCDNWYEFETEDAMRTYQTYLINYYKK